MSEKDRKKKVGSAGRFGARYGTRIRARVKSVEERMDGEYRCPECGASRVERKGSGIWACDRCGTKFAAKAYDPLVTSIEKEISSEESSSENKQE
ncbi:MAG: 50S ribosomal protein L37ae [Candidatus Hadarchaeota archaeon]